MTIVDTGIVHLFWNKIEPTFNGILKDYEFQTVEYNNGYMERDVFVRAVNNEFSMWFRYDVGIFTIEIASVDNQKQVYSIDEILRYVEHNKLYNAKSISTYAIFLKNNYEIIRELVVEESQEFQDSMNERKKEFIKQISSGRVPKATKISLIQFDWNYLKYFTSRPEFIVWFSIIMFFIVFALFKIGAALIR